MRKINNLLNLVIASVLFVLSGCSDDDTETQPEDPIAALNGIAVTAYVSSGESFPSYLGVFEELPTGELPFSQMIEFGTFVETDVFEGNIYVYNWDAASFSKYEVADDLSLSQEGSFSFVNRGITAYLSPTVIYSEDRAFIFDLTNGKLLEWNPSTMTITSESNFETFGSGEQSVVYNYHAVYGDKIILPMQDRPFDDGLINPERTVALFDVASGSMQYFTDNRVHSAYQFVMNDDGMAYFTSTRDDIFLRDFGDDANKEIDNYNTLIRFDVNAGQFDPNFEVDLSEVLDGEVSHIYPLNNNELIIGVGQLPYDAETNSDNFFFTHKVRLVKLNINTLEVTDFTEIGEHVGDYSNANYTRVDGDLIYQASSFSELDFNGFTSNIWRVNESGATKLFDISIGGLQFVERVR